MKISLDEKEMAVLLIDWAKKKYKTHNVSLNYGIDMNGDKLKSIFCNLEITMSEDQFTDTPSQLTNEAIQRIRNNLNDGSRTIQNVSEPDISPQWNEGGEPL